MLKIGLTGGIGTGKTTVAKIFQVLGIPVFDADSEAKKLMNENKILQRELIKEFGNEVYEYGVINKKYLSSIVFSDKYKLEKLNAIVHPITIKAGLDWAEQQISPYVIKEAALIFEAGSALSLDYIIGVFAPKKLRIARVMKRDGISEEEVMLRMNNQIDENIKMKLCDFVITNDEQELLIPQITAIHKNILALTQ